MARLSFTLSLLQVNIGLRVLTRPLPAKLPEIYRTLGTDYAERVLPSIIQVIIDLLRTCVCSSSQDMSIAGQSYYMLKVCCVLQETLKSVIAQYNASQLLTMREVSGYLPKWHTGLSSVLISSPSELLTVNAGG